MARDRDTRGLLRKAHLPFRPPLLSKETALLHYGFAMRVPRAVTKSGPGHRPAPPGNPAGLRRRCNSLIRQDFCGPLILLHASVKARHRFPCAREAQPFGLQIIRPRQVCHSAAVFGVRAISVRVLIHGASRPGAGPVTPPFRPPFSSACDICVAMWWLAYRALALISRFVEVRG